MRGEPLAVALERLGGGVGQEPGGAGGAGALDDGEDFQATEADVDARISRMAEQRKVTPAQIYTSLEQAKRLPELTRSITEDKVFDFLLSQSTVTEAAS